MRIDMMPIVANNLSSIELKSDEKEVSFLEVLDSSAEDIDFCIDKEEGSNVDDELVSLMSWILNSNQSHIEDSSYIPGLKEAIDSIEVNNFDALKLKEVIDEESLNKIYSLEEFLEKKEYENIRDDFNLLDINEKTNKLKIEGFVEHIHSEMIGFDSNPNISNLEEVTDEKSLNKIYSLEEFLESKESKNILNTLNINFEEFNDKNIAQGQNENFELNKEKVYEINSFNIREIIIDEEISQGNNDISILNSIAFPSNDFGKVINGSEALIVREQNLGQDILQAVKYLNNNEIEELNVKMSPKDLGEINIRYLKTEDRNKLVITLSKEDTFSLLNRNINDIKNHLSNLDIKFEEVSIEFSCKSDSGFSDSLNQQFGKNSWKEEKRKSTIKVQNDNEEQSLTLGEVNIDLLI